jgi:hypothetical protein
MDQILGSRLKLSVITQQDEILSKETIGFQIPIAIEMFAREEKGSEH